uniref:C-type lectin domain-containing protein n=1 Tax=Scleropages formosus TaxID=113540 RepID=A0A8C9S7Z2_SCLFO
MKILQLSSTDIVQLGELHCTCTVYSAYFCRTLPETHQSYCVFQCIFPLITPLLPYPFQTKQVLRTLRSSSMQICPQGWVDFSSRCYYISCQQKNWFESQQDCKQRGADLAIINSGEEQDFIVKHSGPFWIGLSDTETEGTWKWVDGTTLYWKENQPDNYNENENCAETRKTDENNQKSWNDLECDSKLPWICGIDLSLT